MKDIKSYINESIGETSTWTYLCMGSDEGISFFRGSNWNPHSISKEIKDKFIIVNTNKNLNLNEDPMVKAWEKKYNEKRPKWFDIILYSFGDRQYAKYIQKIGKSIDSGKITIEDFLTALKSFNGNAEDTVEYIYNKLFKK